MNVMGVFLFAPPPLHIDSSKFIQTFTVLFKFVQTHPEPLIFLDVLFESIAFIKNCCNLLYTCLNFSTSMKLNQNFSNSCKCVLWSQRSPIKGFRTNLFEGKYVRFVKYVKRCSNLDRWDNSKIVPSHCSSKFSVPYDCVSQG